MKPRRVAVLGAGPIGLEMALAAAEAGHDVAVYEAGTVGGHLRAFDEVRLFTPFAMNSTPLGRRRLAEAGLPLPADDELLTAGALASRYLEPLAGLPELCGRIELGARVTAIARDGLTKGRVVSMDGAAPRRSRPFLLGIEWGAGAGHVHADVVIDATGVLGQPLSIGPGGMPAPGEERLGDAVDRRLLPTRRASGDRFAGRDVLLVGCGHSAATALLDFASLAAEGSGPRRVIWIRRDHGPSGPFPPIANDPLPERRALALAANEVARGPVWLDQRPGAEVIGCERSSSGRVWIELTGDGPRRMGVDRVLALVGYRPDTDLFRELRVHLCYATEGPMALAAALEAAAAADPAAAGDCLAQKAHGAETLRTTEPDFYVLGAKSYGRNPAFLLRIGHRQVEDCLALLALPRAGLASAPV